MSQEKTVKAWAIVTEGDGTLVGAPGVQIYRVEEDAIKNQWAYGEKVVPCTITYKVGE
jgi:hypothetical protein